MNHIVWMCLCSRTLCFTRPHYSRPASPTAPQFFFCAPMRPSKTTTLPPPTPTHHTLQGLVPVDDTSDGAENFRGLKWAQPSVEHLRQLMRHVYTQRSEAAAKGAAARRRMVEEYSPEVLAARVVREFRRIEAGIPDNPTAVKIGQD